MSLFLGIVMSVGAILFGILLWQKLPNDRVGRLRRLRRRESGFQGQLTEWLYWDAQLEAPRLKTITESRDRSAHVGDRALLAVLHRYGAEHRLPVEKALIEVQKKAKSPAARAFTAGKMRAATRAHWRTRYTGPDALFLAWFYLIAVVRHGRRHLYLETVSAVLKELRSL